MLSDCQYLIIHFPLESCKIDVYKHLLRRAKSMDLMSKGMKFQCETFHLSNRIGPNDV